MLDYEDIDFKALGKLTKDQRAAAATLGRAEARWLVDSYYQMQHRRIIEGNRQRAAQEAGEPNQAIDWLKGFNEVGENMLRAQLGRFAAAHPQGAWALSQCGIGPVISAGLVARLELRPTVGAWWRLAGLDPTVTWGKGEKRPWNASLKRLCWIIGESFVKVSGMPNGYYGHVWRARKELETERNERGEFAEQAAAALAAKKFRPETDARKHYEAGRLPPAHIHSRSKRYAVKLFLSHLHHVWHEVETGSPPPKPYIISHGEHAHYIAPPGWKE